MSTHCVSMMKEEAIISIEEQGILPILDSTSSNGEEDHHEGLKDQPIKTFDIWSSILSSKINEDSSNNKLSTSPYVHPLIKRSTSSLSEKSLEICTENLGSETGSGSDCFSSSPTSEHEDSDDDKNDHHQQQQYSAVSESSEDFRVVKYNYSKRLISSPKSFPPSLPSVHMQSRRQNGRLVLEAVSVPPKNSLHAQRLDGHLLLTFTNRNDSELEMENHDDEVEEFEQVLDDIQEVEGNKTPYSNSGSRDEEEEDESIVMEQSPRLSSEVINVNRATLIMLEKKNQLTWSKCNVNFSMTFGYFDFNSRFNDSVNSMREEEKDTSNVAECYTYPSSVSQSLPPTVTEKPTIVNIVNNSTISKYYYNNKQVGVATTTNGTDTKAKSTAKIVACAQDLVLIRGNKASTMNNNLVPLLRSCKEPRRSLIIWKPYCIATS